MADPIRLVLADDQALVRGALAALLGTESDLTVVGEAGRGDEVLAVVERTGPDVVLLDIDMPGLDGIAVAAELHRTRPDVRILMVTTFGRPGYLRRAMDAGAAGFIVKDTPARKLADAVRRVHLGLRLIDPALAAESRTHGASPFTAREREVLSAAAAGGSTAAIAARLRLSEGAVRNHLSAAIGKTSTTTRAAAVREAERFGWL